LPNRKGAALLEFELLGLGRDPWTAVPIALQQSCSSGNDNRTHNTAAGEIASVR